MGTLPLGGVLGSTPPLGGVSVGTLPLGGVLGSTPPHGGVSVGTLPLGGASVGTLPLGGASVGTLPLGEASVGTLPLGGASVGTLPADEDLAMPPLKGSPGGVLSGVDDAYTDPFVRGIGLGGICFGGSSNPLTMSNGRGLGPLSSNMG